MAGLSGKSRLANWLAAGALVVVAACLLVELGKGSPAGAQAPAGTSIPSEACEVRGRLFAVAGQVSRDTYGIYLVDGASNTLCLYEWMPQDRKLRLMAARNFAFDLQLDDFNTEPSPRDVKARVEQARRLTTTPAAP